MPHESSGNPSVPTDTGNQAPPAAPAPETGIDQPNIGDAFGDFGFAEGQFNPTDLIGLQNQIAESQAQAGLASLDSSNASLQNQLNTGNRTLLLSAGLNQELGRIAREGQDIAFEAGRTDLARQQQLLDASSADEMERLGGLSRQQQRSTSLRSALAGVPEQMASRAVEQVQEKFSGQISKVQRDYMNSTAYIAALGKNLTQDHMNKVAEIDMRVLGANQEAMNQFISTWEEVTEGKKLNDRQRGILLDQLGSQFLLNVQNGIQGAYEEKRTIEQQAFSNRMAEESLAISRANLSLSRARFNMEANASSNIAESYVANRIGRMDPQTILNLAENSLSKKDFDAVWNIINEQGGPIIYSNSQQDELQQQADGELIQLASRLNIDFADMDNEEFSEFIRDNEIQSHLIPFVVNSVRSGYRDSNDRPVSLQYVPEEPILVDPSLSIGERWAMRRYLNAEANARFQLENPHPFQNF